MKVVGVSGSLAGWKTNVAVHHVLKAIEDLDANIQKELIDLRDYDVEFVNGSPLAYYNEDTMNVVNKVLSADFLVVGSPIYQASISGALKNLLDHLPVDAFNRKVTGMVTTGEIEKHFLVSEYQLKPILSYLKGLIPSSNVFIHNDSFSEENEIIESEVLERINLFAKEMISLQNSIEQRN
ncbi:NADH-dependent FMN reductase [Aquibacillus halophilus]|uniref:NADH-dependent FMN reductase n=1 Tax=Aquibacillus halophilus TaxID=930132 RepID=A0A6A8DFP7_9BACI|nr:NAD(P)H-dependent oxidoreductase [Aquibacillus halophilus]MRH44454.1 NADH-dependent FMN reductase [Aquibacillus halophilus]